jgi:hypothetical protein
VASQSLASTDFRSMRERSPASTCTYLNKTISQNSGIAHTRPANPWPQQTSAT